MRYRLAVFPLIADIVGAVLALSVTPVHAQPPVGERGLSYEVAFPDAATHYASITLTIPSPPAGRVDLMLPVWTPGSYLVREYARHIDDVDARDADGRRLPVEKTSKNSWQVACEPDRDVHVTWRLYCREMSVRTNWVDSDMAILNGAATFLTVPARRNHPHRVRLILPSAWTSCVTALPRADDPPHTFVAADLDELIDSPILCGRPVIEEFDVAGVPHGIAHLGDSSLWDVSRVTEDVRKIVVAHHDFWKTVPYDRYWFLNVISESGGGLEHDNSTLLMTSRWNYRDDDKYEDWLSLVSHEFFHTWNVRRLRPLGLANYDFNTENYTRSLWIAEGITSYYEDLLLARAGLIDQSAWLKRLSKSVERLQQSPGRNVQSLADSSFDAWIKFYRPDENSSNTRVSYYVKGAVVAFLLDAEIRRLTDDTRSLDDVMRLMFERYAGDTGYTDEDFTATVNEVAGADLSEWLDRSVASAAELDYQPALDWYGLRFPGSDDAEDPVDADNADDPPAPPSADASESTDAADSKSNTPAVRNAADEPAAAQTDTGGSPADGAAAGNPAKDTESQDPPKAWIGATLSGSSGRLTVSGVRADSPASAAGLNVGDEILAFNQYRASTSTWQRQLTQLGVDNTVTVLVSRRGELRKLELVPTREPQDDWKLKPVPEPSSEQKQHLRSLLAPASL